MQRSRNWGLVAGVLVCLVFLLTGCGSDDASEQQATSATIQLPDFTRIVDQVRPAVVNISALPPKQSGDDGSNKSQDGGVEEWLKDFFGQGKPDGVPHFAPHPSLGSGFIISQDGYILTNRHVVRGGARIVVKLSNRKQFIAEVVGADKYSDVALLKIDAEGLPTVNIGNPDKLEVGSWVLAIGSPFGFETSVTAGIVSAKGRTLATEQYVPFIQTDVAINPGNSGGPLFNLKGQVVGVNAQIYSRTGGYQGISFAIPIDLAMNVVRQLKEDGTVQRGWLGVQIQNVSRELAQSFGLKWPRGALVSRVFQDSPASDVGLHTGDIILTFNGENVPNAGALPPLVGAVPPGADVQLTVLRNAEKQHFEVEIGELPKKLAMTRSPEPSKKQDVPEQLTSQGLTLEALTEDERRRLGIKGHGVRITDVSQGPGAKAGLKAGDIILAVGKQWIDTPAAFAQRMNNADAGPVALLVVRDGERVYLAIRPEEN